MDQCVSGGKVEKPRMPVKYVTQMGGWGYEYIALF